MKKYPFANLKQYNSQIERVEKIIEQTGYNIVTCGAVVIVDLKKDKCHCYQCNKKDEHNEFPDLFYSY